MVNVIQLSACIGIGTGLGIGELELETAKQLIVFPYEARKFLQTAFSAVKQQLLYYPKVMHYYHSCSDSSSVAAQ